MGPGANYGAVTSSIAGNGSITSGGGFSILYNSTSSQKNAIAEYLKQRTPPPGPGASPELLAKLKMADESAAQAYQLHNGSPAYAYGAGVPDVASLAKDLNTSWFITPDTSKFNDIKDLVAKDGLTAYLEDSGVYVLVPVGGTSASSPITASLFALIVAQRKKLGLGSLGWLSPTLYSAESSMFTDITEGNNQCTEKYCCDFGYENAAGWDPTTGLGQVNFVKAYDMLVTAGGGGGGGGGGDTSGSSDKSSVSSQTEAIIIACTCIIALLGVGLLISFHLRRKPQAVQTTGGINSSVRNPIAGPTENNL